MLERQYWRKTGKRYEIDHKKDGKKREIKVISLTGKATSKKWGDSYNIQNLDNGQISWVNMHKYRNFTLIPEEEVLRGEYK